MKRSSVVLLLIVFVIALGYQFHEAKKLAPTIEDFTNTQEVSGVYTYDQSDPKRPVSRINGQRIYCGAGYALAVGSCTGEVPPMSRVTASIARLKTTDEEILFATSIRLNSEYLYRSSPGDNLHNWWVSSYLEMLNWPVLIVMWIVLLKVLFLLLFRSGK
jgi:hypothetical protein